MNLNRTRLSTRMLYAALAAGALVAAPPQAEAGTWSGPLSAVPLAAASSSASLLESELELAFRTDLADTQNPMFLGWPEAKILAETLEIGAEIYEVDPSGPVSSHGVLPIVERAVLNPDFLSEQHAYRLLYSGRHFSVLGPADEDTPVEFLDYRTPFHPEPYREAGWNGEPDTPERRVPPDGNCLITAMYFLAEECFPTPDQTEILRSNIAVSLSRQSIQNELREMRRDLIDNAAERPFENGRFVTWGPRTSALLLADKEFMAEREQALHLQRQGQASFMSSTSSQAADTHPMLIDRAEADEAQERAELADAIALSLVCNEDTRMDEKK